MFNQAFVRSIFDVTASTGASLIAANVVNTISPKYTNVIMRVVVWVGGVALTGIVAAAAGAYAKATVDDVYVVAQKIKNPS